MEVENSDVGMRFSCPGLQVSLGGESHAPSHPQLFQTCCSRNVEDVHKQSLSDVRSVVLLLQWSGAILVDGERHF